MAEIAVLGYGPAGLLAAHGVATFGHRVTIFGRGPKSKIGGAQYLHEAIPNIDGGVRKGVAAYRQLGTREGYARKVYGDPDAPVSWDRYPPGVYDVWAMQDIYEALWRMYQDEIQVEDIDFATACDMNATYDHVLSSIPLQAICGDHNGEHSFESQEVWIDYGEAGRPGMNVIMYDGTTESSWYRYSRLFDWEGWEYPKPPDRVRHGVESVRVTKPTRTNCNCWSTMPGFTLVGRYGQWEKNCLAHHAYRDAYNIGAWLQDGRPE